MMFCPCVFGTIEYACACTELVRLPVSIAFIRSLHPLWSVDERSYSSQRGMAMFESGMLKNAEWRETITKQNNGEAVRGSR